MNFTINYVKKESIIKKKTDFITCKCGRDIQVYNYKIHINSKTHYDRIKNIGIIDNKIIIKKRNDKIINNKINKINKINENPFNLKLEIIVDEK